MTIRALVLAVLMLGCSSGGGDFTPLVCSAGKTQACVCDDGNVGAQVCAKDGTKWGACSCAATDGSAGSSGAPGCSTDADCKAAAAPFCLSGECGAAPNVSTPGGGCDGHSVVCPMGYYCDPNGCLAQLPNRDPCSKDIECASGHCGPAGCSSS